MSKRRFESFRRIHLTPANSPPTLRLQLFWFTDYVISKAIDLNILDYIKYVPDNVIYVFQILFLLGMGLIENIAFNKF